MLAKAAFFEAALIYIIMVGTSTPAFSQVAIKTDTINSNIEVVFNNVQNSSDCFTTADLNVSYVAAGKQVLLFFRVPSTEYRFITTKNDYCLLKFNNEHKKLYNLRETHTEAGRIATNLPPSQSYYFEFCLDKDSFLKFLKNTDVKMTVCFAKNQDYINKQLQANRFMDESIKKYYEIWGKKDIKVNVSKPDKKQLDSLVVWLENIK